MHCSHVCVLPGGPRIPVWKQSCPLGLCDSDSWVCFPLDESRRRLRFSHPLLPAFPCPMSHLLGQKTPPLWNRAPHQKTGSDVNKQRYVCCFSAERSRRSPMVLKQVRFWSHDRYSIPESRLALNSEPPGPGVVAHAPAARPGPCPPPPPRWTPFPASLSGCAFLSHHHFPRRLCSAWKDVSLLVPLVSGHSLGHLLPVLLAPASRFAGDAHSSFGLVWLLSIWETQKDEGAEKESGLLQADDQL